MHDEKQRQVQSNRYAINVIPIEEISQIIYDGWDNFLSRRSLSCQLAPQRPHYVRYLAGTCISGTLSLISIFDRISETPTGFVPVETKPISLSFSYRTPRLGSLRLRGSSVIGSEPLLSKEGAFPSLFQTFHLNFPQSDAFEFQEVSPNSNLWRYLTHARELRGMFGIAVIGGFKLCHVIDLPPTVAAYQQAFSRKKLYNLKRQVRMLEGQLGHRLDLLRIENLGDVEPLTDALGQLEPARRSEHLKQVSRLKMAASANVLLSFIIRAGERPVAVITGEILGETYRVHRIVHDRSLASLSPGATAWHLVLMDLIQRKTVSIVDMGYGTPAHRHRSTNRVESRGRVLVYRRRPIIVATMLVFTFIWNLKLMLKKIAVRAGLDIRDLDPVLLF